MAQNRGQAHFQRGPVNPQPRMSGTFGSVLFPGGQPGFGSVVFPGGGGPRFVVPGSVTDTMFGLRLGDTVAGRNTLGRFDRGRDRRFSPIVTYPIFVGGYYDTYAYPPAPPAPPQQNITVIYPPQPSPVYVSPYEPGATEEIAARDSNLRTYRAPYNEPTAERPQPAAPTEPQTYLLAFKDRTVYSAVAYWVDGETLHYFTSGNQHNQATLSLVDREMTERLNKLSGVEVKLPNEVKPAAPAK